MRHPDTGLAYLFWLVSFAGINGLHRFYLGKPVSGFLYMITVGFFGIGTIVDAFRMPELVRRARLERRIDQLLDYEEGREPARSREPAGLLRRHRDKRRTLEHAILTHAMEQHGIVMPSRIALQADTTLEKAREHLERLVVQGFANPVVSREGAMLYVFPEFLDDQGRLELDRQT
ncbi:MAG: TM2 domain-containing protein [Spirochaetaceae bacterium]|nr:MAG: TM2 domain-containing protein [Spirochaetaceae bacterium]